MTGGGNNVIPNVHFRKVNGMMSGRNNRVMMRTWFDQAGRKKRRALNRQKKAAKLAPRPAAGAAVALLPRAPAMVARAAVPALLLFWGGSALVLREDNGRGLWGADDASVLQRMQYWRKALTELPSTGKYLLFTPDSGGLNNIRIGWEMSGLVALHTDRTLVLPPKAGMYLLDFGPWNKDLVGDSSNWTGKTGIEDLIDLHQLKGVLPTLTSEEFQSETGMTWQEARDQSEMAAQQQDYTASCHFSNWDKLTSKFVFMDGKMRREAFSCGEWWLRGGPRPELRQELTEADWGLLRHGFVWHPDAFAIAAKAVRYLGLFDYLAIHARYGDFAEKQSQRRPDEIYENWRPLIENASALYVATDRQDQFVGFAERHGVKLVMWPDLFTDASGNVLSEIKRQFSPERFFKLTGPVEELICTFARVFVGTDRSSFSGHIQRMRIHADPPVSMRLVHTDGNPFLGGSSAKREAQLPLEQIQQSIRGWEKREWVVPPINKGESFRENTRFAGLM